MTIVKDSQAILSYVLLSQMEALDPIIREMYQPFCMITTPQLVVIVNEKGDIRLFDMMISLFDIKDMMAAIVFSKQGQNYSCQAFLAIDIVCKSDQASCKILSFRTY